MLTLFRRHLRNCPHRPERRRYHRCRCPIAVEGSIGKEKIRRSLNLTSWEAANKLIHGWEERGTITADLMSVEEAKKKFLARFESRVKAGTMQLSTLRTYDRTMRQLAAWCEAKGIKAVSLLTTSRLLDWRLEWTEAGSTQVTKFERLRAFLKFCLRMKWISEDPLTGEKQAKPPNSKKAPYTALEFERIVAACDEYTDSHGHVGTLHAQRLKALVLVMRYTGLRITDTVCLPKSAVADGSVFIYTQKTTTPVRVPVPPVVTEALNVPGISEDYWFWTGTGEKTTASGNWQRSLRKLFKIAAGKEDLPKEVRASLSKGHAHRFRHTMAVELLTKGVPVETVATILGNSPAIVLKHYAPWVKARQDALELAVKSTWS